MGVLNSGCEQKGNERVERPRPANHKCRRGCGRHVPASTKINETRARSNASVFTMNSISFSKNLSFYNEKYCRKTSVFTAFLKTGSIRDLCFFTNTSFYNEFGTFLSACFKNVDFYHEFCLLSARAEAKTYLCSKALIFTMSYAHFFKNISFYEEKTPSPNLLAGGCWPGLCRSFPLHCLSMVPERLRMSAPLMPIESRSQGPVTANIDGNYPASENPNLVFVLFLSLYGPLGIWSKGPQRE